MVLNAAQGKSGLGDFLGSVIGGVVGGAAGGAIGMGDFGHAFGGSMATMGMNMAIGAGTKALDGCIDGSISGKGCSNGARDAEKDYVEGMFGQAVYGTLSAIGAGAAAQIAAEKKAAEDAAKAAQDAEDKKNQENNIKTNQQNVRKDDRQEEELAKINGKDMSKMTREDVLSLSKDDIAKLSPSQKVALRAILMSKYLTASLDGGITPPDDVSAKMYDLDLTLNERIDLAKSQAAAKYMDYANEQRMLGETPISLEEYQNQELEKFFSKAEFSGEQFFNEKTGPLMKGFVDGVDKGFHGFDNFLGDVEEYGPLIMRFVPGSTPIVAPIVGGATVLHETFKAADSSNTPGQRTDAGTNSILAAAQTFGRGTIVAVASGVAYLKDKIDKVSDFFTGKPTIPNVIDGKDTKDAKERIDDANIHLP